MSDSESDHEAMVNLDKMTKEQLFAHIHASGCRKLAHLNPRHCTKEQVIDFLIKERCPVMMKYMFPEKDGGKK
jgi:hypothetical protein